MPIGARVLAYRNLATGEALQSLYTSQTPSNANTTDGGASPDYEFGTKFTADRDGQISAIRFYKASSETGTHVGRIWNAAGTQLAGVTFSGETASGWQQQALATPLSITGGTIYTVSYNINQYYAVTSSGFASQRISGDLSSVVGKNGAFNGTIATFPDQTFSNSDYFGDVVYQATTTTKSPVSLFKYYRTPTSDNQDDGTTYEMGLIFSSRVAGTITHIAFWKPSLDTVTHTGRIWDASGTQLASVVFSGESASGWQQQALATPLSISASTTYTVSVNCRYYPSAPSDLTVTNTVSYLSIPANGGVFGSVGARPTGFYQGGNYFRDLVFVPS